MYQQGGVKRFYSGCWMRGLAVVLGIFVMGNTAAYVKQLHEEGRGNRV
jgi:hypothetical protein